ncbi:MAG: molybdenum cofactor guanylyltransferase [Thermodesulfobacteriota bacterium]|nr:molybdenum cofactor guanylyltransferase [Desulfovibrionales bacterium]MDQ7838516.1 molybdenum cofactor guanylyltransferase [Thermodesulfobacteriota bacterium]
MTAIILAGGKSERMKENKALLALEGRPIIGHICEVLKDIFDELIVVTNHPCAYSFLGVKVVTDLIKGKGPLGGLYTGLFYAASSHAFVVACDMPFLKKEVIDYILKQTSPKRDVIVPLISGGYEPLHAVYARRCLDYIHEDLIADQLKTTGFYNRVRIKTITGAELSEIDPEMRSCININTPEDWVKAQ